MTFEVGDRVRSRQVGPKKAFDGKVVRVVKNETLLYYIIKDARGSVWHRTENEITRIRLPEQTAGDVETNAV